MDGIIKLIIAWLIGGLVGWMLGGILAIAIFVLVLPLSLLFYVLSDGSFQLNAARGRLATWRSRYSALDPFRQADEVLSALPSVHSRTATVFLVPFHKIGSTLPRSAPDAATWDNHVSYDAARRIGEGTTVSGYPTDRPAFSLLTAANGEARLVGVLVAFDPVKRAYRSNLYSRSSSVVGTTIMIDPRGIVTVLREYDDTLSRSGLLDRSRLVTTSPERALRRAAREVKSELRKAVPAPERDGAPSVPLRY